MEDKIKDLRGLLFEELEKRYSSEKQQLSFLKSDSCKVEAKELNLLITKLIYEVDQQIYRLEQIFHSLDMSLKVDKSPVSCTLIQEANSYLKRSLGAKIRDVIIINKIQHLLHSDIAGYGSTCTYANELGLISVSDQLHLSLEVEKSMDERFSSMAIMKINEKAL